MLRPYRKGMRWRRHDRPDSPICAMSGLAPVSRPPRVIAVRFRSATRTLVRLDHLLGAQARRWQFEGHCLRGLQVPEVATKRLITASATKLPPRGAGSSARVSALWGIGERVIRIAGIHKIGTGFAQQSFDLLDRSPNYAARLAGLNLALQLERPRLALSRRCARTVAT